MTQRLPRLELMGCQIRKKRCALSQLVIHSDSAAAQQLHESRTGPCPLADMRVLRFCSMQQHVMSRVKLVEPRHTDPVSSSGLQVPRYLLFQPVRSQHCFVLHLERSHGNDSYFRHRPQTAPQATQTTTLKKQTRYTRKVPRSQVGRVSRKHSERPHLLACRGLALSDKRPEPICQRRTFASCTSSDNVSTWVDEILTGYH